MSELITAKALRSFLLKDEIKTVSSDPFEIEKHLFNQLKSKGLVGEVSVKLEEEKQINNKKTAKK